MLNTFKMMVFGFVGAMFFHLFQISFFPRADAGNAQILNVSGINLIDQKGRLRAQLGFSKDGPPGFWIFDERDVARVAMGLYPDGTSHFGLQDKSGQMIQLMRSWGPSESPFLIFKHQGQDMMITGLSGSTQLPFLMTYDKSRKRTNNIGIYDGP